MCIFVINTASCQLVSIDVLNLCVLFDRN